MSVVDAIVSKVLDVLLSTISSQIKQEARLIFGVKKQVKLLTSNLESIKAVLIDAEKRQYQEATVRLWLERLNDISYDIDDVLDECSFKIMRSRIKGEKHANELVRKVWSFTFCSCRDVVFRHVIAVKIRELNERLDVIANEKDKYGFHVWEGDNERVERPITTSFVDMTEVKGREADKEKLINMLLAENCETPNSLHLISIVGMGGIGKTSLAKLVYNDKIVKTRFEKRIWVCVSNPFDEIRVAKAILESSQGFAPNQVELQNVAEKIRESLEGKRFLIVLDDVWNEDRRKWKELEDCLKCGLPGSKILMTTRNANVATTMGCTTSDIFRIGLLPEDECLSIFYDISFHGKSSVERTNLEEIAREFVIKCKGLPLAIKTLAGLLRFKNTRDEWKSVLDSHFWELEEVEKDVLATLRLSYYDLPSPMKQCFLYCATFPKDFKLEKDQLIEHWMAQDYLKETKNKDKEMIGDYYFQSLSMRSLFQDFEVVYLLDGKNTYCKMHDVVHDFATSLVERECRLDVDVGEKTSFPSSLNKIGKLRNFTIQSTSSVSSSIRVSLTKIFSELTCLRSLNLSGSCIVEIPSEISKLIHLRLLDLSHNGKLQKLHGNVCKLYNLQTLNVDWCQELQKLPKRIGELVNLRHLHNVQILCLLPEGIGRLSGLKSLNRINIDLANEEAFSLKDLNNLNHISGSMDIRWLNNNGDCVEDAKQAHLKEKKNITGLGLLFPLLSTELYAHEERYDELLEALYGESLEHDELLEALSPPPSLELLRIHNYMGKKSTSWINSLACLTKLQLSNWSKCKHFPPLGQLPSLEVLDLNFFDKVKEVGVEFLRMNGNASALNVPLFAKLTSLIFTSMYEWEEWKDYEGPEEVMPSLQSLSLTECEKLKGFPNFILKKTQFLQLKIAHCYHLKV